MERLLWRISRWVRALNRQDRSDEQAETPLFHIPRHLILGPSSSELRSKLSEEEWEKLGAGWSPLILTMMWEESRGSESPWGYYLCVWSLYSLRSSERILTAASLPKSFDTPMFWSQEQLKSLQGTDIEGVSSIQALYKGGPADSQTALAAKMLKRSMKARSSPSFE